MYVSFFKSGYNCKMALLQYLKKNDKSKVPLSSNLISYQSDTKRLGDKVTTSGIGKKWCCQYEYSAKERMGIDKYFREVLRFPYIICHLGNMHMLITPSCKLAHIK